MMKDKSMRTELKEKRSANRKVFENQDHSRTVEIYMEPVHYKDTDGSWQEMDDKLEEVKGMAGRSSDSKENSKFCNSKGNLEIQLENHAVSSATASMTMDGAALEWGLEDAEEVTAEKKDDTLILYPGILKDADLQCRVHGEGLKEDIILHGPEAVRDGYAVLYHMAGVTPVLKNNCVHFLDDNDEEIFCVHAPCMKDASGIKSESIRLGLEMVEEDLCRISFLPDREWMTARERVYPLVIDPVTTTSKKAAEIYDAHVDSFYEEDNFQQSIILKTMGGDEVQRSFIRFELPEMKTGDMVVNARLVLVSLAQDNAERTVEVHRVLHTWNSNSINWYNKPLYSETIEDLCRYKGDKQKYITMDITRMVKDWYQNGGNYGLMLKDDYELSGYTEFLSSDCDNGYQNMRPRIDISYVNYSGLEDYWTYHSQEVGRAGTVHVNDYNGNLIMVHDTMATGGSLMPVAVSHVYNSNNCAVNLGYGYGFALNYHQTLVKTKIGSTEYYKHTDGDGTIHYFYYDSTARKWKDESGLEQTLTIHTDGTEQLVIHDKEDNQLRFKAGRLVKIQDKNGNQLSVTWMENRVTAITDGAGRKITLDYSLDANGKRTTLSQITGPSGKKKIFTYSGGNLMQITDIDGEVMTYAYDGRHMLTSIRNIDGYSVRYAYYGTNPYRVRTITEYGGSQAGESLTLTYGYNSTKFTDNKNRSEIYRFNNNGNLLHIHDGFGRAASGKYNRSGNHVNRLENATKLQTNVVQLLKDPIIQAATCGWKSEISSDANGKATINTNAAFCKIGDRSLKLESTAKTGRVCWYQDVSLLKGQTYTVSMFAKITAMDRASDGSVFLRAKYQDKDNVWHYEDSEYLKTTTADFVHLHKTFTFPADNVKTSVRVYLVIRNSICTVYGDMAQLETGSTVSRCNLVDNGDFHSGNISGFTKTGDFEDKLTTVGTSEILPVQSAIVVSATKSTVYTKPSLNAASVTEVTKGTHLYASCYLENENIKWFKVRTKDGKRGYLHGGHATAYLGGNTGDHSAVIGVSGAVLRSSASDSGTVVEETIPRGTCVVLRSTKKDTKGKIWFYIGMQIDKKRYTGYIKEESVIRLCRNYPRGTMSQEDKLYDTPSLSGKALSTLAKGKTVRLRGVLTKAGVKWYAIQRGEKFCFIPSRYCTLNQEPAVTRLASEKLTEGVGGLENHVYRFMGEPKTDKRLKKVLDLNGKKGDTFMVNAWGKGTCLPETNNDKNRRFGVEVVFVAKDNTKDIHYTNFSPDILDWQFLSDIYVAQKDYVHVEVSYTYCRNANTAYFDGLSLYREEFGQTYTYDTENNLISAVDSQKNATKFEYNSGSDLTGITDPKGSKYTYTYDKKHNVISGKSAMGIVNRLVYDSKGNIISSGVVQPDTTEKGTWVNRTFTADKNHVAAVTDAEGNKTQYEWDTKDDLLKSLTDGRGNKLIYGYDNAKRLVSVSQDVTVNGEKQTVKNSYTYAKDQLTEITHNGFKYGFGYDGYGNTSFASIAGVQVVSYQYEANNGNLMKTVYANGDEIRYSYDSQDRITASYLKNATASEKKLNTYIYDKEGNLCKVTNHLSGKTYELDYDFLDRLMRVRDERGACYEYTYDKNNQMTKMFHTDGRTKMTTTYAYDKDGRETEVMVPDALRYYTEYDRLGRVVYQNTESLSDDAGIGTSVYYDYPDAKGNQERILPVAIRMLRRLYSYEYDKNGNITKIERTPQEGMGESSVKDTFQYDERNQLIRENSQKQNKTIAYAYDQGGNLLSVKEYAYTEDVLPEAPLRTETGTYSSTWKDQLLNWNGTAMTYDTVGNMLTRGDTTYTWTMGRKLAGVDNGKKTQYFYDHTGARVKKVVDEAVTEYHMAGDLIASETSNGKTMWYIYDSGANLLAVNIDGKYYTYVRNIQNDIIALVDASGKTVVNYMYDSWGKLLSITGSLKDTVGVQNPFRYRGYYYDNETGMYYLKNRYYDPELRRFISADMVTTATASMETLHNRNLYAYCGENPLMRNDEDGKLWVTVVSALVGAVVGGMYSVGTQMIMDGKSFDNINWTSVACSAATGAIATTAVGKVGQALANGVAGVISSRSEGETWQNAVFNGAVSAFWAWRGGAGSGYGAAYDYLYNVEFRINRMRYDTHVEVMAAHLKSRLNYLDGMKKKMIGEAVGYAEDFGRASVKKMFDETCVPVYGQKKSKRIIGYAHHYDGRTKRGWTYPIYG